MIQLRNYQISLVAQVRELFKKGVNHILVQLPTGGGKTVVFSYISAGVTKKGNRVLILTDREELMRQAGGSLQNFGLDCYYIKAGAKFIDYRKNTFVAMSQTLRNRINKDEWRKFISEDIDIIVIDEAHIQEFNYIFESGLLEGKRVLGFTATPSRTGKMKQLGLDYERLIRGAEPKDLIKLGYLLNCDLYEFDSPNMSGVKINPITGDYDSNQTFAIYDKQTFYKGLVLNYQKYAEGKKMIVFCCNVEHAIKTTIELNNSGYRARFIASEKSEPKMPNDIESQASMAKYNDSLKSYQFWKENHNLYSGTRKQVFDGFANNDFKILVNVDIATKGYDQPDIEVVAVYRATTSTTLWLQMIGRGSRIFKNKDHFIVLDFGGNKSRLGGYDINREWSLWHDQKKSGGGVPPMKLCGFDSKEKPIKSSNEIKDGCKRLILASYMICPFCGFKYPNKKDSEEVELTLSEIIDDNGISLAVKKFSDMNWDELDIYRKAKKHKTAWLWRQLWTKGGEDELKKYATSRKWSQNVINQSVNYCRSVF